MYENDLYHIKDSEEMLLIYIREHVFNVAMDNDPEFKELYEKYQQFYENNHVVSSISDGDDCFDPEKEKDLYEIGEFFKYYEKFEDMMEIKMYYRGFKDCLEFLKKIGMI